MNSLHDTRRKNFMSLIAESLERNGMRKKEIAQKIGQNAAYISHVTNSDPERRRGIDEEMARKIEKVFGKDRYWLDIKHDAINGYLDSSDKISDAISKARLAMKQYEKMLTPEQEDSIYRAAIEAAMHHPLTEKQFEIIIEIFLLRSSNNHLNNH